MNESTRRSSGPVDPLQDLTVLALCPKSLKVLPDPSKTADFGGDLHAAQNQIKSMNMHNSHLIDLAKNIVNGASETHKSGNRQTQKQKDAVFHEKDEANRRERRPIDAGRKRGRFSMKPATNLLPPFDVKKYKDADECFRAFDRHENARKEIEKQLGGAVLEPAPPTKRIRQPLGMSVKQKHHFPLFNFEPIEKLISTQETFKTSIPSPVNHSLQTEPIKNVVLDEVDIADSRVEADDELRVSNQTVPKPAEDVQEEKEVCSLIEECFNITPFEIDELCLSESPKILESDFVSHRRTSLRPTDTDNFVKGSSKTHSTRTKGAEGYVHLVLPTKPKSPLSSLLAFKRSLIKSNPSGDRFSAYDLDQLLEVDSPSVENSHKQSDLVDLGEQMSVADELKSPFFKQKDNSEFAKGGSPEVTIEELSHASERYVSDGSSKMGMRNICDSTRSDVDTEVIEGGSNVDNTVRDKTASSPHTDTDTCENGDNNCDKLEDRLEEAVAGTEPELNVEDSSLENLNNSRNELAPEHPTDGLFKSVDSGLDKHNEVMQEHPAVSVDKQTEAKSRPGRKRKNKEVSKRQSLAGAGTTCQSCLDTNNEIMQEHPAVSMDKQTEAKSRPGRKQKHKEVSKRQSLAGSGTTWQSGVRRSTRFRTRPLHYWKGERLLYGRVHDTLTTVIGIKYLSPGKGMTVKSFVSDEYIDLVESAALH